MTLEAEFLTTAADKLAENLARIETCLTELPPGALWARDSDNENAVGNLLLHLDGNVRQWIIGGVGGRPDTRDRPSEFSARTGAGASVLFARLHGTVGGAVDLIRSLPHQRLGEAVSIQDYDTTVLAAIFHVVEHFSGHTYQIILLTKRFTGKDLGFYAHLDKTGRRGTEDASDRPVDETLPELLGPRMGNHRTGMAALLAGGALALLSSTTGAQAPAAEPRFELAVVKVNDSGEQRVAGGFQPEGGRYSVTNYPLRALIAAAYLRPQVNPDFLIAGGPDWIDTARFNIEAKAAGDFPAGPDGPNAPRRVMLQHLLAERFGLRVHHESRQERVFALLRARDDRLGPNLRPSQIDCGSTAASAAVACASRIAPGSLALTGTSLTALVNLLPRFVDHVVVDSTGLTGRFDIELTWTPGPTEWMPPPAAAGAALKDDGASLTTALREQLGLRLQARTAPVDVLVVDAATWPTGN